MGMSRSLGRAGLHKTTREMEGGKMTLGARSGLSHSEYFGHSEFFLPSALSFADLRPRFPDLT